MRDGQHFSPAERDALINDAREAPVLPSLPKMAVNLAKAVGKHLANGMKKVDFKEYQRRLDICNGCPLRLKTRCTHESCGCFLDKKAWWDSEECPLGNWEDDCGV